jgi:hypothetical protein
VIQFEGLHLQYPDVTVYRWNKGIIEVSTTVQTAVLGSTVGNYAILGDDKRFLLEKTELKNQEINSFMIME